MFPNAMTVGRIRGVAIRIDISWLLVAALVTWSFWGRFTVLRGFSAEVALAMAVAGALLFFGSVLAHELAHALEARHRGVEVAGITLFLFGGVSETKFDVKRPRDEFALTAVGPFTSFVLAAVFGLISTGAQQAGAVVTAEVAGLLGWINLALGVFNLLPGAPLDGGRILRSAVWWITGDRRRSIRAAAMSGRVLGGLIIGLGLLQVFFVPGALIGGLWFVFIGWFLSRAAMAEQMQAEVQGLLEGVPVRRLLPEQPRGLPVGLTVDRAVDAFYQTTGDRLPVVEHGELIGLVGIDQIRRIPREERPTTPVSRVMLDLTEFPSVEADADVGVVLDRLGQGEGVVVARDGPRVVGVLTDDDVALAVRRAGHFDGNGRRGARRMDQRTEESRR